MWTLQSVVLLFKERLKHPQRDLQVTLHTRETVRFVTSAFTLRTRCLSSSSGRNDGLWLASEKELAEPEIYRYYTKLHK